MALISAANPQFPRAELIVSPSSARPVCVLVTQLSLILCNPMDCSPPDSSVHGLLQATILKWVAMPSSRGSSDPGIEPMSLVSPSMAGSFFYHQQPCMWEAQRNKLYCACMTQWTGRKPLFRGQCELFAFSLFQAVLIPFH